MADAYKTIAKGALVILIGTTVSKIFTYMYRILLARGLGPEAYGIFSICFAIVSILAALAIFGTPSALERYIPLFGEDKSRIKGLTFFVLKYALILGAILTLLLIFVSGKISLFLGNTSISPVLAVFALSIPVLAALQIFSSITKAFKNVLYYTLTNNIIYPVFNLLFAFVLIIFGQGLISIAWAFLIANMLAVLSLIFMLRSRLFATKEKVQKFLMHKEIIAYSLPLLFVSLFFFIISWTDTVMLAYFLPETVVGLYNAAIPTAQLMYTIPVLVLPLFLPIISDMFSKKNTKEISALLKTVTYWIISLNLPLLFILVLFGKPVLGILFGAEYTSATLPMVVLSVGFFIYTMFLPAVRILELYKRTKFIFVTTSLGAVINIMLNLLLIPVYGMLGAAIASAIALVVISLFTIIKIKVINNFSPFSINFLKSSLISILVFLPFYSVYQSVFTPNILSLSVFVSLFGVIYFLIMYQLVFTKDDKELIHSFLRKTRITQFFKKT